MLLSVVTNSDGYYIYNINYKVYTILNSANNSASEEKTENSKK